MSSYNPPRWVGKEREAFSQPPSLSTISELQSQIDKLEKENEELRKQLKQAQEELTKLRSKK